MRYHACDNFQAWQSNNVWLKSDVIDFKWKETSAEYFLWSIVGL